MSNGDDVLDNWEEIDEAGLNSPEKIFKTSLASSTCERITETSCQNTNFLSSTTGATTTSLSRPTQMKLLQRSATQDSTTSSSTTSSSKSANKSPLDDMSSTFQPVMMVLHKPQDEYQSANYTPSIVNQTVKILRRPTQSTEPRNNGIRPKQPIKTLQQREQEYAEARLRILGSAKNPEDEVERTSTATTTSVATSLTNSTPSTPTATSAAALNQNSIANVMATTKINSPKIQIGGGANQFNNHYNQQLQQQQYQQIYQQQQQPQQNYFYNQQQQQPPQSPAYNNNRTYNMNPLLGLGPMGSIGQPAQYQTSTLTSQQTLQQQQLKFQQYHQKSPQQQHKNTQQTWSPVVGGSVSSASLRQQPNDTILRVPRGPDGTTGFQVRR